MKCLSVQQPWASLICGGIKDVENRSWRVKEAPGRILIHAGKNMRPKNDIPLFFRVIMDNAITSGYIPDLEEMALGAIIGYADVTGFTEETVSDWAQEGHGAEWKWVIENARFFKTPIPYRGRQGLFDVPEIDINNLPEVIEFPEMTRNGSILQVPVNSKLLTKLKECDAHYLYLTEENRSLFANDDLEPLPTDNVVFIDSISSEKMTREVDELVIQDEVTEDGDPITYYGPDDQLLYLVTANILYK